MKVKCDLPGIRKAQKILSDGGIIIFPTDTVYGIGCDPFDKNAVMKIYSIKNRNASKPLPVLVYSKEVAEKLVVFDSKSERIVANMWPGPLTVILKVREGKLKDTLGIKEKIAVRVPNHRCVLKLLKQCKYIVGTSANISGSGSAVDPKRCEKEMAGYDLLLDDGKIIGGNDSTIIEMVHDELKIHRTGKIKKEEILKII